MKALIFPVLLLFLWVGIALQSENTRSFDGFREEVYTAAARRNIALPNVVIEFGNPSSVPASHSYSTAGECHPSYAYQKTPKIIISLHEWNKLSEHRQRSLIYHEMGHCAFGLQHTKVGLMAAELTDKPYSIDELFR